MCNKRNKVSIQLTEKVYLNLEIKKTLSFASNAFNKLIIIIYFKYMLVKTLKN